jgi:hypothetical protein
MNNIEIHSKNLARFQRQTGLNNLLPRWSNKNSAKAGKQRVMTAAFPERLRKNSNVDKINQTIQQFFNPTSV